MKGNWALATKSPGQGTANQLSGPPTVSCFLTGKKISVFLRKSLSRATLLSQERNGKLSPPCCKGSCYVFRDSRSELRPAPRGLTGSKFLREALRGAHTKQVGEKPPFSPRRKKDLPTSEKDTFMSFCRNKTCMPCFSMCSTESLRTPNSLRLCVCVCVCYVCVCVCPVSEYICVHACRCVDVHICAYVVYM